MMTSPDHQSYRLHRSDQDLISPDCHQGLFLNLEEHRSHCSPAGQSPFLQGPVCKLEQDEQQQVVVASNDLPISDMELAGFLDMDDRTLSELTGVNTSEWSSLFNGQLDDVNSLDPMTGMQADTPLINSQPSCMKTSNAQPVAIDRWLVEETQKLERQQKLQQQKLMELQQTLLKTEILKNQLQIATISQTQSPTMSTTTSSLLLGAFYTAPNSTQQSSTSAASNFKLISSNLSPNPAVNSCMGNMPSPKLTFQQTSQVATSSSSIASRRGRMSTCSVASQNSSDVYVDKKPPKLTLPVAFPSSPPDFSPNSPELEPSKRKVHNLIEKKYRCSINDRICLLRDMVSRHSKDNKKLQKSAVLQKTIDFIHHLQNTITKLQEENQQLRESLAIANGKTLLPSFTSPPNTPGGTPNSYESEVDSGHPSSPDDYTSDGQMSRGTSPNSKPFFSQYLHNPVRNGSVSQYLMVVMLAAIFFVNPLSLSGSVPVLHSMSYSPGKVRTLSAFDGAFDEAVDDGWGSYYFISTVGVLTLRIIVACLCFGWITLKSTSKLMAKSQGSIHFWRLRKQAEKDLQKGEYLMAKENLKAALSTINRPIPTSYFGMIPGLIWSLISHILFQLVIGRYALYLASMFVRNKTEKNRPFDQSKKPVIGVTFDDVSQTYHLLHQINLSSFSSSTDLHGMGFFLCLNALNFAEADRPFHRLSKQQFAEMYFMMGLQCHFSIPFASNLPMQYYFLCFRNVSPWDYASPLKWATTQSGKTFLMSSKWEAEVQIGSRLYVGNAALPAYSVTRAYCKELLSETFGHLLLPDHLPGSPANRDSEGTLQAFKFTLNLAKEANSCLLNAECDEKSVRAAAGCSDSGFSMIQCWASIGIVSCYWLAGNDSYAEDYYSNIESLSGEMGAAAPSALQLAFKANRMYKRPNIANKVPLEVVLQLCATTSISLERSVANLLQDHSKSTENELHQLALLQACDWLLSLKVVIWENHGKEEGVAQSLCPGFYQDLETLSKLITILPSARSRLHLYKGCYQLIAGANPIMAHALLNSTGSASLIRRRSAKDPSNKDPTLLSHEHAMAKEIAYKYLPPSMELPHSPTPPPASI